ncbi:DUF2442 [Desulfonema limicola]|uniref:DUF2442 n=1 Tax=Desulfonema limicola TaxID=45656 RepID=A0A975GJ35_9BACT|nr:DUF2442 domain-containing protein [Desulfonema limicola]QTA82543.1 DUF2442 [Desulfonema limicola]
MNTLTFKPLAKKLRFDSDNMWLELTDGRQLGVPLVYFPRLLNAEQKQLEEYIISGGGSGLHWDNLDEDISVKSLLLGIGDQTQYANQLLKKAS